VQNLGVDVGNPGGLIGMLSWNGNTYYTGIGGPSDLFNDSPYTATVSATHTDRQWPPYEKLVTEYLKSTSKIQIASVFYPASNTAAWGAGNWMSPFPGADIIFDDKQLPRCYVMFRWIVPKVTNEVIKPSITYEAQAGSWWTGVPSGTYTCPGAEGSNQAGVLGNWCVFDKPTARDDVRKWCDANDSCGGYVVKNTPDRHYLAVPASNPYLYAHTEAPPNLYYKKNKRRTTTSGFANSKKSEYFSRSVK
jgi:hypothetical protein